MRLSMTPRFANITRLSWTKWSRPEAGRWVVTLFARDLFRNLADFRSRDGVTFGFFESPEMAELFADRCMKAWVVPNRKTRPN
jgi:hypothetical protein